MKRYFVGLVMLLFGGALVWGQATTTLTGAVTDPTGAAVPGAKIVIENQGTMATREVTST